MDYFDLIDHISLFDDSSITSIDSEYHWPVLPDNIELLSNQIILRGRNLKNIPLNKLQLILGGLSLQLEYEEMVMALHCTVSHISNHTLLDLKFAYKFYSTISASAISGQFLEEVLMYYENQGMIQLMLVKNGLFWLRTEPVL